MEDSKYVEIEEQALRIVETLNNLKAEIEGYKDARLETEEKLDSLDSLISAITTAAKELSAAAEDVRKSDYVVLQKQLTEDTKGLFEACSSLKMDVNELPSKVDKVISSYQNRQEEVQALISETVSELINKSNQLPSVIENAFLKYATTAEEKNQEFLTRINALDEVIARIDRNTQKGFGKERS